jgi:hypothetical protein
MVERGPGAVKTEHGAEGREHVRVDPLQTADGRSGSTRAAEGLAVPGARSRRCGWDGACGGGAGLMASDGAAHSADSYLVAPRPREKEGEIRDGTIIFV